MRAIMVFLICATIFCITTEARIVYGGEGQPLTSAEIDTLSRAHGRLAKEYSHMAKYYYNKFVHETWKTMCEIHFRYQGNATAYFKNHYCSDIIGFTLKKGHYSKYISYQNKAKKEAAAARSYRMLAVLHAAKGGFDPENLFGSEYLKGHRTD